MMKEIPDYDRIDPDDLPPSEPDIPPAEISIKGAMGCNLANKINDLIEGWIKA